MTNDGPWLRVHCLDIIHQLSAIAVPTETIDCDNVAADWNHTGLATIIDWDLGESLLQSTSERSIGLITHEAQGVIRFGCPVLEVLYDGTTRHHP